MLSKYIISDEQIFGEFMQMDPFLSCTSISNNCYWKVTELVYCRNA